MKRQSRITVALAAVLGTIVLGMGGTARADWLRAESERFIVYSDGGERDLRDYVQKLEMFDRVMQYRTGVPANMASPRKLPIYLVANRRDLVRIHPQSGQNVMGTYFPTEEDIFAVAVRRNTDGMSGEDVLMHEYAHHFMLGNVPAAYPAWLVEGFAEYYMTAEIDVRDREVILGRYNENRAYWIMAETWIPLNVLLTKGPGEVRSGHQTTYYSIAWLLTHWFLSDPERAAQLAAYLADIARGENSVAAMEEATGMTVRELESALRRYTRTRLAATKISGRFPIAEIEVIHLSSAADDLLLLNQRLKVGVPEEDRAALGQEVARLAAQHGDDPLALMAAGHAGLHFGDRAAGERALERLLELEPGHVEALQYMAQEQLRQARETDSDMLAQSARGKARDYLARAYAAGENEYRTLMLMSELRQGQPGYPNDNDLLTLGLAMDRAPQLATVRFRYASVLAQTGDREQAVSVLRPLANNPHGGGASAFAGRFIASLESGGPPLELIGEAEEPQISEPEPEAQPDGPTEQEPAALPDSASTTSSE